MNVTMETGESATYKFVLTRVSANPIGLLQADPLSRVKINSRPSPDPHGYSQLLDPSD